MRPLPLGSLAFNLYFEDEKHHYCHGAAPVPVTFWFRPATEEDKTPVIPTDILEGICQLPPSIHAESRN